MQTKLGTNSGKLADGDKVETKLIQECRELDLSLTLTSNQLWNLAQVS